METQNSTTPLLQILVSKKVIWYRGEAIKGAKDKFDEFISSLPQNISNLNDRLEFFTYFDPTKYKAEKSKTIYDFKLKTYRSIIYDPDFSETDAEILLKKCEEFFENLKLEELRLTKDQFMRSIEEQLKYRVSSLRDYRDKALKESDWTQMSDVPFSDVDKENWKKYRSTLRDLPNDPSWSSNTAFAAIFPIDPATYKLRYPNYEVDYLSTPDQFENQKARRIKERIVDTLKSFNLPSLNLNYANQLEFANLITSVNDALKKIDPELKVNIVFEANELNVNENLNPELKLAIQFSGMTTEAQEAIKSSLVDNSKYTKEQADSLINTLSELGLIT